MAAPPSPPTTDRRPTTATRQQTLGLGPVLHEIGRRRRPRVLDLGPALGANVEFLARFSAQLFIADLYRSLKASPERLPPDPVRLERTLAAQLALADEAPFDLILAWDLLNYFEPRQIEVLGQHLGRLCRPAGLLFALIATRGPISNRPLSFQIQAPNLLLYETVSSSERQCPSYRETELERLLDAFAVQTSFLLRNGMQEYVFTRRVGHMAVAPPAAG